MRDIPTDARDAQIIVYDDDNSSFGSVDLIRTMFGRSDVETFAFAATSNPRGQAVSSTWTPEAPDDMLFACGRLNVSLLDADGEALRAAAGW
jgi:hypothetical protein